MKTTLNDQIRQANEILAHWRHSAPESINLSLTLTGAQLDAISNVCAWSARAHLTLSVCRDSAAYGKNPPAARMDFIRINTERTLTLNPTLLP